MRSEERRQMVTGIAVIAAAGVLITLCLTRSVPFVHLGYQGSRVKAAFASTSELRPGDPVRVGGIKVGRVDAVDLVRRGRAAVVTMRITNRDVRVQRDARASLRWRTLLGGNPYIDLE